MNAIKINFVSNGFPFVVCLSFWNYVIFLDLHSIFRGTTIARYA